MATLNGWQRLWVVATVMWAIPVVLLLYAMVPEVYIPPKLHQFFYACESNTLRDDVRDWYKKHVVPTLEPDDFFVKSDLVPIEVWKQEDDRRDVEVCTGNTVLAFNAKTKSTQLPVFARLEPYGTLLSGYDLDSAIHEETQERTDSSREQRRDFVLFGIGATVGVPGILYAFGTAIAWIRRGFKKDGAPRDTTRV